MTSRVARQVRAILEENALEWSEAGGRLALQFDSAVVVIGFTSFGAQSLIQIQSNVLSGVDGGNKVQILVAINALNCETVFGKWAYYADERIVALEYDLLGDTLQEAELMTALATVARLADHHDDLLQRRIGGLKAVERVEGQ